MIKTTRRHPQTSRLLKRKERSLFFRLLAQPLIALTAALAAASGHAQGTEYKLELVVFHRTVQSVQTVQHYSPAIPALIPAQFNSLGIDSDAQPDAAAAQSFSTTAPQRLANAINRLQNKEGYRLLYAAAWRQSLQSPRNAIPLRVRGQERAPGVYELDGTITISQDRFLHAQVDLGFSELSLLPGIPTSATSADSLFMADDSLVAEAAQHSVQTLLEQEPATEWQATASYRTNTRSSLESGEINYLDHPYLGVLLYVEPIEAN